MPTDHSTQPLDANKSRGQLIRKPAGSVAGPASDKRQCRELSQELTWRTSEKPSQNKRQRSSIRGWRTVLFLLFLNFSILIHDPLAAFALNHPEDRASAKPQSILVLCSYGYSLPAYQKLNPAFLAVTENAGLSTNNILNGKISHREQTTTMTGKPIPMFDWQQIERWGGQANKLAAGSIIVNRPSSVWDQYKWYIIGAVVLFLGQLFLVASLLIQRRRRGRAEAELKALNETLEQRVADRTAELQQSEVRYRSLFNTMTEGFALHEIITDADGKPCDYRFLGINPAFERLTGLSREAALGKTVREVIPGIELHWIETYGRVALEGTPLHIENYSAALNRWYEVFAYQTASGQFAAVFTDITKRKLAEEELRQSREDLDRAQEVGQIGSWRMDVLRNVLTWSKENHRIFGVPEGTPLTYETFLEIVHPDDRQYVDRQWMASLRGEPYDIEHRILVAGEVRWVREKAYLEFDDAGKLLGGFGTTQDITETKRAQEALRVSKERLELLATVAERLLRTEDPQAVIEELCQLVMAHIDCQFFFNYLVEEYSQRMRLNACAGISEEAASAIRQLDFGVAVCGCAARDGERIIAEDIQHQDDPRTVLVKSFGVQAYCCHPLLAQGRVIGTLSFGTRTRPTFAADEVALMKSVSDQVAVAMQRLHADKELRLALAKAEEGDRMLSALMEYVPEGITLADAALNLTRVSRYGQELLGAPHAGKSTADVAAQWDICHADGQTSMAFEELPLVRAIQGGEVVKNVEVVQVNSRGERLPLLCTAGPIRDAADNITGGIVVWRDITDRKQAEEELRRLSQFPEENPNPVLRCTPEAATLYMNSSARRWLATLDWQAEGALPAPVRAAVFSARGQDHATETEITDPNGRTFSFFAVQPLGEDHINLYGIDLTDRKRAEQALRASEERLRASLEEKEVLLKEIHHRVKNNMQVISSLVALQADNLDDPAMRSVLLDVTHRVRSMAMVHEKLYQSADLARIELADYVRSLLNYLWRAHGAAAAGVRLALDLEPVSLPVNAALPCGLILNELVGNALKHAFRDTAGGEVTVWLRSGAPGRVRLCVRDNGSGLPPGWDWRQGRSLGLRLVQMLAGQLHAAVDVSNSGGSEFTITFEGPTT